jgi:hypothetical protein
MTSVSAGWRAAANLGRVSAVRARSGRACAHDPRGLAGKFARWRHPNSTTWSNCSVGLLACGSLLLAFVAYSQQPPDHSDLHKSSVDQRGDHVMGFSHEKTTHHFLLYPDGGAIQVEANDANDTASRDQIRMHLSHIAKMFADGNFQAPMLIHDQTPPGVPVLQKLKADVTYQFEKTGRGGLVRAATKNPEALQALHEFLRFQIIDHGYRGFGGSGALMPSVRRYD